MLGPPISTHSGNNEGTATFYQYFSVRSPKKGFGNISGTITVSNHFNYWASQSLNLGNQDYMVLATEGYQSRGSSDITVSEGSGGSPNNNAGNNTGGTTGNTSGGTSDVDTSPSSTNIVVRPYDNGECGGGEYSETMHCSGVIGFGNTSGSVTIANTNTGGDTNNDFNTGGNETPANSNNNSNSGASCQCDWYGSMYAVCQNSSGWGWENNQSCISESTCNSQDGNGGLVCN